MLTCSGKQRPTQLSQTLPTELAKSFIAQQSVNWALDTVELPVASWVLDDERLSGLIGPPVPQPFSTVFIPSHHHLCGQVFLPLLYSTLGTWKRKALPHFFFFTALFTGWELFRHSLTSLSEIQFPRMNKLSPLPQSWSLPANHTCHQGHGTQYLQMPSGVPSFLLGTVSTPGLPKKKIKYIKHPTLPSWFPLFLL